MSFAGMFGMSDQIQSSVESASIDELRNMLHDLRELTNRRIFTVNHGGETMLVGDLVRAVITEIDRRGGMSNLGDLGAQFIRDSLLDRRIRFINAEKIMETADVLARHPHVSMDVRENVHAAVVVGRMMIHKTDLKGAETAAKSAVLYLLRMK